VDIRSVITIIRMGNRILTESQTKDMADSIEKLLTLTADSIDINFRSAMGTEKPNLSTCRILEHRFKELNGTP
jgi:hypothetical protein